MKAKPLVISERIPRMIRHIGSCKVTYERGGGTR